MEYYVNFIGLSCFERAAGGFRHLWMPDGRVPPPDVQAHWASVAIAPDAFVAKSGWLADEISEDPNGQFEYFFPPSNIIFPTTQATARLDTSQLDGQLIELTKLTMPSSQFVISATPTFVASVNLMHGSVAAFGIPNTGPSADRRQYFARWTVPHDNGAGAITIVLTETRGWPVRTLTIKARSDVSIINTSRGGTDPAKTGNHFQLYERLSATAVSLKPPGAHPGMTEFQGPLPKFENPSPATGDLSCSPVEP